MRAHPLLIALLGWLLGSFFGLSQLMGFVGGARKPVAPAAA